MTPPQPESPANVKTVAIFGGYAVDPGTPEYDYAHDLGARLAQRRIEVLNGGYDGTMKAASQGAKAHGGTTIGITCPSVIRGLRGELAPNEYLDVHYPAPDLLSRINMMMRLSGGFVVLDGGTGTLAEFALVWEFVSKGFIPPRPIVLAGRCWDALVADQKKRKPAAGEHLHRAETPQQIADLLHEKTVRGTRARNLGPLAGGLNDSIATLAQLRDLMNRFVAQRDWQPFHDPKNLSASIAIEAAELMEHFQWLRSDQLDGLRADPQALAAVKEEVADVFAYLLSFANALDIDLASALTEKMRKNEMKYPVEKFRGRFR